MVLHEGACMNCYDYEDYMRTRIIPMWNNSHPRYTALLITCKTHNDTAYYTSLIPKMSDEEYCNLMLTLIHQTNSMLDKMIDKIKRDFLQKGGIKEQMYRARTSSKYYQSNPTTRQSADTSNNIVSRDTSKNIV